MLYSVFLLILLSFNLVKMDYDKDDFMKLYKLEGEWSMPFKDGQLVESWEKISASLMRGSSFYVKDNERIPL